MLHGLHTVATRCLQGEAVLDRAGRPTGQWCFDSAGAQRAVELNPVNQWNQACFGDLLSYIGRADEGLEMLRNARRADPYFGPPWYWRSLGIAQFVLRRYADALADFERGVTSSARYGLAMMAGCYGKLGVANRARELVAEILTRQPKGTIDKLLTKIPFKQASDSEHLAECLRLAGMPE